MNCGRVIHDYILGLCYYIPCELDNISLQYMDLINQLGFYYT